MYTSSERKRMETEIMKMELEAEIARNKKLDRLRKIAKEILENIGDCKIQDAISWTCSMKKECVQAMENRTRQRTVEDILKEEAQIRRFKAQKAEAIIKRAKEPKSKQKSG